MHNRYEDTAENRTERAQVSEVSEGNSSSRTEHMYMWKIWQEEQYVTPREDPMQYERAIDFVFPTADAARTFLSSWELEDEAAEEEWVLVKVTYEPVGNDDHG